MCFGCNAIFAAAFCPKKVPINYQCSIKTCLEGDQLAQNERYHGGLVFFDANVNRLDDVCRAVSSTLEDYGYLVERQSILDDGTARITSSRIAVRLQVERDAERSRLILTLTTADRSLVAPDMAQLVLLAMIFRILETHPAHSVEWLDPATVLPAGKFVNAVTKVSPRRVRGRQQVLDVDDTRFLPVEETEETICSRYDEMRRETGASQVGPEPDQDDLSRAFHCDGPMDDGDFIDGETDAESDIRRLATWGLTGVVACLSGPVGLSMAAVNLMRGEDFRLNTHVLALTGFLAVSTSTGMMSQVVSALPI